MAEKQYNDALSKLTEIARLHPEMMDEVEKRIGEVRSILDNYNSRYAELIKVLFEQHNVGKALKIIKELEDLNPHPNISTLGSLVKAKRGAEVVYNLNRFEEIMNKGLKELKDGLYFDAMKTYIQGFALHREEFQKASYGNIVKNSVEKALSGLRKAVDDFMKSGPEIDRQYTSAALLVSGREPDKFSMEAGRLIAELRKVAVLRNIIYNSALVFDNENKYIKEHSGKNQDDYFLYYAYSVTTGRKTRTEREGILAAIEIYWEEMLGTLTEKVKESAALFLARGKDSFDTAGYTAADTQFKNAYIFYYIYSELTALWEARISTGKDLSVDRGSLKIIEEKLPVYLFAQEKIRETETYRKLGKLLLSLPTTGRVDTASKDIILASREKLSEIKGELAKDKELWKSYEGYYKNVDNLKFDMNIHISDASSMIHRLDTILSEVKQEDVRFVNAYNFIQYNELKEKVKNYSSQYKDAKKLSDGYDIIVETIKDEKGKEVNITRHVQFPSLALQHFNTLGRSINELRGEGDKFLNSIIENEELRVNETEYKKWVGNGTEIMDNVDSLLKELNGAVSKAKELILQAERYKNEGMLRLTQARSELKAEKFSNAKEHIKLSGRAFETSLTYEENGKIRDILDKTLPELSREIVKQENLFVVREVRRFINKGRRFYGLGDFVNAEASFLKAKARWADTNPTENKEITNWLTIVRSALSIKSGREISDNNPLYTEMTQLINLATEDFLRGKELLSKGRKVEALKKLKSATDKLERVRLSFPYNREARVLTLKIQELSDPENFSTSLTKFYNDAVKNFRTKPQEAYADLKDIEEIKPDYPGLKRSIYNLEITLKIRIPPPDPKKIAESNRLYAAAYRIVIKNQVDLFPSALAQLNKAIELNPDNRKAAGLKDRIQIAAGGTVQAVLSSIAQEQYKIAEDKYLAGKYFEALVIVERLLKNKRNQGYPPLLELKRRIKAKI
ncbi:MAG: hypothetical protein GXP33_14065 [Spirochaetes bacterium]|nr:hypothetical protein [Spirochaetota bacterium]